MNKEEYDNKLEELIQHLEMYPCSMGCYLTIPEMRAAQDIKYNFIKILKESLLEQ